jgi:hypothetical protein
VPIDVSFINGGEGVVCIARGCLTSRELIDFDLRQLSDPDTLARRRWTLMDISATSKVDISTTELRELSAMHRQMAGIAGQHIVAIVAAAGSFAFGMGRMWEAFLASEEVEWQTRIFRNREEAEWWLKEEVDAAFGIDLVLN